MYIISFFFSEMYIISWIKASSVIEVEDGVQ